jgi:selenocysteine lyase/cysteine desulfurase
MKSPRKLHWDQAATARPKSVETARDFQEYLELCTANPHRGMYEAARVASEMVDRAREKLAEFVNLPLGGHIVFSGGTTDALNLAILGGLNQGDHVIATVLEHNSVLRPLRWLEMRKIINVDYVEPDDSGAISPVRIANLLRDNTRLVCVSHASNVVGNVQDLAAVGQALTGSKAWLLVDAAQTAGIVPLEMEAWEAHLVVFSSHKAMQSIPGVGCLAVAPEVELRPQRVGGTGSLDPFEIFPAELPMRLEAGTLNSAGIFLLNRAVERLPRVELLAKSAKGRELRDRILRALSGLEGLRLTAPHGESPVPVISVEIPGLPAAAVAAALDEEFGVEVRSGFHCAPLVHRWMGTLKHGSIRLSPPFSASADEIEFVISAMGRIAEQARGSK